MANRFDVIPEGRWRWLGPGFNLLSTDLAAVEAASGMDGGVIAPERLGTGATGDATAFLAGDGVYRRPSVPGGATVLTNGPYTLDPNRAPTNTVIFIPTGTPILTHIGNRWTGTPTGQTPDPNTQALSGTLTLSAPNAGTATYTLTGGENSITLTTSPNPTDLSIMTATLPPGITEIAVSVVLTLPPVTADIAVMSLNRTSGMEASFLANKGVTGTQLIANDSKTTGSWNRIFPDTPNGATIRLAISASIGTGTDGTQTMAAFIVHPNGTETQIGTTHTVTAASTPATDRYTTITVGKITNKAGMEAAPVVIHSIRAAHGTGASRALLRDEREYPEAT